MKTTGLKNFINRALFGAIYVALILAGLYFGKFSYLALIVVLAFIAVSEFAKLAAAYLDRKAILLLHLTVQTGIALSFSTVFYSLPQKYFLLLSLPPLFLFISYLYKLSDKLFKTVGILLLGTWYISLPFMLSVRLTHINGQYDFRLLLGFFILIWASDTFAYIFGNFFGKHKLFKSISPKKTLEGALGGAVSTIGIALLLSRILPVIGPLAWAAGAIVIVVFGIYGDLLESAMKRLGNIKDSGDIIPGHGGILDRLDSFLISLPVLAIVLLLIFNLS